MIWCMMGLVEGKHLDTNAHKGGLVHAEGWTHCLLLELVTIVMVNGQT